MLAQMVALLPGDGSFLRRGNVFNMNSPQTVRFKSRQTQPVYYPVRHSVAGTQYQNACRILFLDSIDHLVPDFIVEEKCRLHGTDFGG